MIATSGNDWSPAENLYAIAVSQSQLWRETVRLSVLRMRDEDDRRVDLFSSRQLDAHLLVITLRQLLTAEQLEQAALKALAIDPAVSDALAEARTRFEDALPGIKDMPDALMHLDESSYGASRLPHNDRAQTGDALRDVARDHWPFAYDPDADVVSFGPHTIHIDVAEQAAHDLSQAIYTAARAVDETNTAELRSATIEALEADGIRCDPPAASVNVSAGTDRRIWLSLDLTDGSREDGLRNLSERIVAALAGVGLGLGPGNSADPATSAGRLHRGEALYVEPAP